MSTLVIGSSNTDMIINLARIPVPGETVLGGEFSMAAGGKGANQAVAAARAGGDVKFLCCLGEDTFGEQALNGFRAEGMDVSSVKRVTEVASGVALIFVEQTGENSIAVASGSNDQLMPADIAKNEEFFAQATMVLVQLETPLETVEAILDLAAKNQTPVILNPAPAQKLDDRSLAKVSILTPNETEAEILTGIPVTDEASAKLAAEALRAKSIETVIITMGPAGAFVCSDSIAEIVPSFQVDAADSTAAGDTFNGFLATCLAEGMPLLETVRLANAAAAMSVTIRGAQPSVPKRKMVEQFIQTREE